MIQKSGRVRSANYHVVHGISLNDYPIDPTPARRAAD